MIPEQDILLHREKMDKITDIFKPWSGWGCGITETYMLLDLGLLDYSIEEVKILSTPTKVYIETSPAESLLHVYLKYTASQLLRKLGEDNPLFEYKLYDVYSPKLKIRIECGHTDPNRLLHSIIHDIEFWLLQYPEKDEELATLYRFSPSKDCEGVLKRYYSQGMKVIGTLLLEQYGEGKKKHLKGKMNQPSLHSVVNWGTMFGHIIDLSYGGGVIKNLSYLPLTFYYDYVIL